MKKVFVIFCCIMSLMFMLTGCDDTKDDSPVVNPWSSKEEKIENANEIAQQFQNTFDALGQAANGQITIPEN